jgi:hypothetical protein
MLAGLSFHPAHHARLAPQNKKPSERKFAGLVFV